MSRSFDPAESVKILTESATAAGVLYRSIETEVADHRDKLIQDLKASTKGQPSAAVAIVMGVGRRDIEQKSKLFRQERIAAQQVHIDELQSRADKAAKLLTHLDPIHKSARSLLESLGSQDPRFAPLLEELRGAGASTLATRKAIAEMDGDTAQLAAIARVNDALPAASRLFSSTGLADTHLGADWAARQKTITVAKITAEQMRLQRKALETGRKIPAVDTIRLGLDLRAAGAPPREPREPPPAQVPESVAKIARGMKDSGD